MCGDCWNAAMGAPAAVVAARFAWVGYRDRIPLLGRRSDEGSGPVAGAEGRGHEHHRTPVHDDELVEAGAPPP